MLSSRINTCLLLKKGVRFFKQLSLSQFPYGQLLEVESQDQQQGEMSDDRKNRDFAQSRGSKKSYDKYYDDDDEQATIKTVAYYHPFTRNLEEAYVQQRLMKQREDLKPDRIKAAHHRWAHAFVPEDEVRVRPVEQRTTRRLSPEEVRSSYNYAYQSYLLEETRAKASSFK